MQKPQGLLGTGCPGRLPLPSHSSWTLWPLVQCCFTSTETIRAVRDVKPKTVTSIFTQLQSSEHVFQCCFTSTETTRTIRDRESRTATSTFTQLLSSEHVVQCCFMSTETIRAVRDREPKTATSTFTQLMNSGNVVAVAVLYIPGTSLSSTEWPLLYDGRCVSHFNVFIHLWEEQKSQSESVHEPQLLMRKESRSRIEPTSYVRLLTGPNDHN